MRGAFMCPRVDEFPHVVSGAVERDCEQCGTRVRVGPKVQWLKLAHPEMPILCTPCAVPQVGNETELVALAHPDSNQRVEDILHVEMPPE